ncbi:unnamed protein product [Prunus armeniaca]|uniref:Uncharacterized protein n=1 Tax=Prunus armeniaca TaxID=36596 RepID=A0A6J5YA11_PRUAR|nr:unnamed protein product [Prunus armeniaca]
MEFHKTARSLSYARCTRFFSVGLQLMRGHVLGILMRSGCRGTPDFLAHLCGLHGLTVSSYRPTIGYS